eukprot:CAMPEP_0196570334 /NCGR_PEP_ID=MMETSP1081-20130531/393_1 /TAXON_ID=36882 /ORGANISM="Pyramimonas amylifera, Strain CCMP720" /LENGTH=93 /DNA_ID=CAMNT_0041886721 /DNA_START=150 /DNA_END=431 /DNA_ORIENTATION=+
MGGGNHSSEKELLICASLGYLGNIAEKKVIGRTGLESAAKDWRGGLIPAAASALASKSNIKLPGPLEDLDKRVVPVLVGFATAWVCRKFDINL